MVMLLDLEEGLAEVFLPDATRGMRGRVQAVALDEDARIGVVTSSDDPSDSQVWVFNVAARQLARPAHTQHSSATTRLFARPALHTPACGREACRGLWSPQSWACVQPDTWRCWLAQIKTYGGISDWVSRGVPCVVAADGELALSASWDRRLCVWDLRSCLVAPASRLEFDSSPTCLAAARPCLARGKITRVALGDDDGMVHLMDFHSPAGTTDH